MRKFIGLVGAVALLWVAAAPAQAITLEPGVEVLGKLLDYTSFLDASQTAAQGKDVYLPTPVYQNAATLPTVGDELLAVFQCTSLKNGTGVGFPYYSEPTAYGDEELTGVIHNLVVADRGIVTTGVANGLPTVTPLVDAGTGLVTALVIDLYPVGYAGGATRGGVAELWLEPSVTAATLWDPTGGPTAFNQGAGTYPSVAGDAGSSVWLSGEFVPLPNSVFPGAVYEIYLSTAVLALGPPVTYRFTGIHTGLGFVNVLVNNTGYDIADDIYEFGEGVPGSGRDVRVYSNLYFPGAGQNFYGWALQSQDPFRFFTVPEPASMSLLLVGLVGSAGAYWRRRRAA